MVETDAPYAAPIPHRGKRNEPIYVVEIDQYSASLKREDENIGREKLLENSKKMFGFW